MNDNKLYEFENIEAPERVLLENILGGDNKIYEVPLFQRNYSWSIVNCEELYNDVIESFKNHTSHFIGIFMYYNVTASNVKNQFVLIDGQQRLTTIMLLLRAIKEVTKDKSIAEEIDKLLFNSNIDIDHKCRLKQNNFEDDVFKKILSSQPEEIDTKSKLFINYNYFVDRLSKEPNKTNFKKILNAIKKMEAVEIRLKSKNIIRIQQIFEKINSAGKALEESELIGNYLLFAANPEEQKMLYNKWTCVEKIVGKNSISNFVKAYTIMYSFEYVDNKKIYKSFKRQFKNKSNNKVLNDMLKYSVYFAIIEKCKIYYYKDSFEPKELGTLDKYLSNTLKMLNALGNDDLIPFLMMLFDRLYESDLAKLKDILELILEYMIRYRIAPYTSGGGALQSRLYGIMKKIEDKSCALTVKSIYSLLSSSDSDASRYPTDAQFMSKLKANMIPNHGKVALYQFSRRKKHEIMDFDTNMTLEHLMPQTIDDQTENGRWWIKNLGSKKYQQVHEKYKECIGNYALLTRKLNSSISNGAWPNKRKEIRTRAFDSITREVVDNYSKWNEKSIQDRNDKLANEIKQYITGPKSENNGKNSWLV